MISYNYLLCAGGLPVEALVAAADPPTARNKATQRGNETLLTGQELAHTRLVETILGGRALVMGLYFGALAGV